MKAFTVRDPWGWAIAYGGKTVENRRRSTSYRGPIAVHVGLGWDAAGAASDLVLNAWATWRATMPLRPAPGVEYSGYPGRLERNTLWLDPGHVVAVAELVDCHRAAGCCAPWGENSAGEELHHLVLADVRRLKPVPARGRLGVPWTLPDDVAEAVEANVAKRAQLAAAGWPR